MKNENKNSLFFIVHRKLAYALITLFLGLLAERFRRYAKRDKTVKRENKEETGGIEMKEIEKEKEKNKDALKKEVGEVVIKMGSEIVLEKLRECGEKALMDV